MKISVVIPTHNRADLLNIALEKLYQNDFPSTEFEIIIVDDNSTDNTKDICKKWEQDKKNLKYIYQKKAGQGVARNKGIAEAKGEIIVFSQDDIFTTKQFLKEHYQFHKNNPQINLACLGLILWDPETKPSDLMRWSTNEFNLFGYFKGPQFDFYKLKEGQKLNYNYFYTSNVSLKRELLLQEKFDPWFDGYGWEDIELAYRLHKTHNLQIIYNPAATVYHHHPMSMEDFRNRMIKIGNSLHRFTKKHPEIKENTSSLKKFIFQIIGTKVFIYLVWTLNKIFQNKLLPVYYYCLSKRYFLIGYNNSQEV